MIYTYPAVFMKYKKDNHYGIYFPDLDNITDGNDLNDAMFMATDLLALTLSTMIDNNQKIPFPSQLNSINAKAIVDEMQNDFIDKEKKEDEISEYFVNYISVDPIDYAKKFITKYDKKTLTIPHWLNVKAQEKGINYSKTLTKALIDALKI